MRHGILNSIAWDLLENLITTAGLIQRIIRLSRSDNQQNSEGVTIMEGQQYYTFQEVMVHLHIANKLTLFQWKKRGVIHPRKNERGVNLISGEELARLKLLGKTGKTKPVKSIPPVVVQDNTEDILPSVSLPLVDCMAPLNVLDGQDLIRKIVDILSAEQPLTSDEIAAKINDEYITSEIITYTIATRVPELYAISPFIMASRRDKADGRSMARADAWRLSRDFYAGTWGGASKLTGFLDWYRGLGLLGEDKPKTKRIVYKKRSN